MVRFVACFCLLFCLSIGSVGCGGSQALGTRSGSMARFIARNGYLYALNDRELKVYRIIQGQSPTPVYSLMVNASAETLFSYGSMLFVGTRRGMLIYSLQTRDTPTLIGQAEHLYSCDPVVVENDFAYVTLRADSDCRFGENLLLVFDVSRPTRPEQIARYPLGNPHGLAVDGPILFVTDKKDGLQVLDISDPYEPRLLLRQARIKGYDAIADRGMLYISADSGLYQYTYNNAQGFSLTRLSRISIGKVSRKPGD